MPDSTLKAPRGQKFRKKGTDLINHMVALGRTLFSERLGIDEEAAAELAREYAHELAQHWGGQQFYFPLDMELTLSRRDREIFAAFTGNNHDDLARRYKLSFQHVYRIIDRVRRQDLARRQGRLFEVHDQP